MKETLHRWTATATRSVTERRWSWPRRETAIQLGVWLGAALICVFLLARHARESSWTGLARGRIVHLSVPWDARVEATPVSLFQHVRRGDVVAILDHSVLAAQIQAVEAEIARLRSEHDEIQGLLDAEVAERRSDWSAETRAFARDAAELAVRLKEAEADLEYDRSMLVGLEGNAAILEKMFATGHVAQAEVELARAEAVATANRAAANERLVLDLRGRLAASEAREAEHAGLEPSRPARAPANDHLAQAIAVQVGLQRELEAQRDQCILRAPFDGTVVEIRGRAGEESVRRPGEGDLRRPGEVVGAGEPVIAVAAARPSEIVTYVASGSGDRLRPGVEVELVSGATRQVAASVVEAVGPAVERMPESMWGPMQVPRWGRPILVRIPQGFDVAVGDTVGVRLP